MIRPAFHDLPRTLPGQLSHAAKIISLFKTPLIALARRVLLQQPADLETESQSECLGSLGQHDAGAILDSMLGYLQMDADFASFIIGEVNASLLKHLLYFEDRGEVSFHLPFIFLDPLERRHANPGATGELTLAPAQERPRCTYPQRITGFPFLWFAALLAGALVEDLQHSSGETADGLGPRRQVRLFAPPLIQALQKFFGEPHLK